MAVSFKRLLILSFLCLLILPLSGQNIQITRSSTVVVKEGVSYYLHTVEKGHTLYSVSKAYGVTIEDITGANPGSENGLALGQALYIPLKSGQTQGSNTGAPATIETNGSIFHVVKQGETLYGVAKIYNTTIEELQRLNPDQKDGLRAGDRIRVPGDSFAEAVSTDATGRKTYKVKRGEDLSEIARMFGLEPEDIVRANPDLETGLGRLPKGIVLIIPEKSPIPPVPVPAVDTAPSTMSEAFGQGGKMVLRTPCASDPLNLLPTYKAALMLPFYASAGDTITAGSATTRHPSEYPSFRFIQFYEGVMMALDTLEKLGLRLDLKVLDVAEDTTKIKAMLLYEKVADMDLIIGPLYSGGFNVVSHFAAKHSIPIVNPFTSRDEVVVGNPGVFKAYPSEHDRMHGLAEFLLETYPDAKIFVAGKEGGREKGLRKSFTDALVLSLRERMLDDSSWVSIIAPGVNPAAYSGKLSRERVNIFVTLCSDQVYVSNLLRKLDALRNQYSFIVVGLPSWEGFSALDPLYIMNLNLHLYSNSWVDYSDKATIDFVRAFRERYHAEPDAYAFQGYDLASYFCTAMMKYGEDFSECLTEYNFSGLQTQYRFKGGQGMGYTNSWLNVYRISEYREVDARRSPLPAGQR